MHQNLLNIIRLLNLDANPYTVDARLDQDPLILISCDNERIQQDFGGRLSFDFGDIVSFRGLRGEVGEAEGGGEGGAHALQVGSEGLRLSRRSAYEYLG